MYFKPWHISSLVISIYSGNIAGMPVNPNNELAA